MKLEQLFPDCGLKIPITDLAMDSRAVKPGSLFFCIDGTKTDGHSFAAEAKRNGAAAIVASRDTGENLPHIIVPSVRETMAVTASRFFGEPAERLKLIGVTGTNGKTTTTYILQSILQQAGKRVGVIGTNAIWIGEKVSEASLTTPDPIDFHRILADMVKCRIEYVVMEVSAHALALQKMAGVRFAVSAFTNFSRDHLDFFKDMDAYFEAKAKLFTPEFSDFCVLNADDEKGRLIADSICVPFCTYGQSNPCDVFAMDLTMSTEGLSYILNLCDDIGTVKLSLPGKFNMYNTLCAAAIASRLGIGLKTILEGIKRVKKVDGRFNMIGTGKCSIIVDFAHTPDGLLNILSAVREFAPRKIITVFGCGGDRDKEKRPVMGKIVSEISDRCFITGDNPRSEEPEAIIFEILSGIPKERRDDCVCIADRKAAIREAVLTAEKDDIVLVAGKGAEKFTEVSGQKIPYNDEEYILELIEELKI